MDDIPDIYGSYVSDGTEVTAEPSNEFPENTDVQYVRYVPRNRDQSGAVMIVLGGAPDSQESPAGQGV